MLIYILSQGNNGNIVGISWIRVLRALLHSNGRDYGPADSLGKVTTWTGSYHIYISLELYDQLYTLLHHVKTVQTDFQVSQQFWQIENFVFLLNTNFNCWKF